MFPELVRAKNNEGSEWFSQRNFLSFGMAIILVISAGDNNTDAGGV